MCSSCSEVFSTACRVLFIDNECWDDVPFIMKAGKSLHTRWSVMPPSALLQCMSLQLMIRNGNRSCAKRLQVHIHFNILKEV
ncbi:hypothetical protein PVAP13_2NG452306 [Panicum virgatum]|uniref:Uncharacterized protein n=1 Tax=Panicum virgatum TaxID=38727 RepID=A0A8T0VVK8_PANVG|nr:hypothetical protein PVAP13_2NG452306 [Panicum virgatum]